MKTLITSLFLLLTFFSTSAQDLDFVHSYGPTTEGSSSDRVNSAQFESEYDKVVIAGSYYDEINLEIGSNTINLSATNENLLQGFVGVYTENYSLMNAYNIGTFASKAVMLSDSTFAVIGGYSGVNDFDPRPDSNLLYEGSLSSDGFVACYKLDGTPLWFKSFTSLFTVNMLSIETWNNNVIVSGFSSGTDLTANSNGSSIDLENSSGTNSFLFSFSSTGELNWYHLFDMDDASCTVNSLSISDNELVVSLLINTGNLDVALTSDEEIVSFAQDLNSYIGIYNLENLNLLSHSTLYASVDDQFARSPYADNLHLFGHVTSYICRGNNLSLNSNNESDEILISGINNLDYLFLNSTNENGWIKWMLSIPKSDVAHINHVLIDQYGYSYLIGYYKGSVFYNDEELLFEENASSLNNGFIMKLDPVGNLVWAHNIPAQQGELEVNSVSVNEEQDILISGYYTGNHDFDFTANTQLVGNFEEENGFLARYTQEPNEAQVFLNVPILHTEIEEAGATSLVYVSINREISEDVVVEATPDEQIDLGNGAGQPVELTFTPNGEKIMSLDITAFDDLDVEGDHTGTIIFSTSGEEDFTGLDDQTITFDIIDNDPDIVEEQNAESQISVYPNPATDAIRIDFPQTSTNKRIDLIRILDANGRPVVEIEEHPKDQTILVKDLSKGSYILKVNSDGSESSTKLVIQ